MIGRSTESFLSLTGFSGTQRRQPTARERSWRSTATGVSFTFLPENNVPARHFRGGIHPGTRRDQPDSWSDTMMLRECPMITYVLGAGASCHKGYPPESRVYSDTFVFTWVFSCFAPGC
jgi:hypothetical protein